MVDLCLGQYITSVETAFLNEAQKKTPNFFRKMQIQEVIVIGKPVNCMEKFERQTIEDIQKLYNLIQIHTFNLECHTYLSQRRFEKNEKRWNRFIIILALMYLIFILQCLKLFNVVHQVELLLDSNNNSLL